VTQIKDPLKKARLL